jgi:hypothetical protein
MSANESNHLLGYSSIAPSEKGRQNELAFNESVCDQSFESDKSFDQCTMSQHTLQKQQTQQMQLLKQT